jgi:hypothetical protein
MATPVPSRKRWNAFAANPAVAGFFFVSDASFFSGQAPVLGTGMILKLAHLLHDFPPVP